jgi:hypothetical protein
MVTIGSVVAVSGAAVTTVDDGGRGSSLISRLGVDDLDGHGVG